MTRAGPGGGKRRPGVLFGEPETHRFLSAVERLKQRQQRREFLTRQAKLRLRQLARKSRVACA